MRHKTPLDGSAFLRLALFAVVGVVGAVIYGAMLFERAAVQTRQTVGMATKVLCAVLGAVLLWRAGLAVYDALYGRFQNRAHDQLDLEVRKQDAQLDNMRILAPDFHGRQGIAFDGRTFRDLDSKASYTMDRNEYLNPVLEQLNAQQKMLTALCGAVIKGGDLAAIVEQAEPEPLPVQWPSRVPLRGLLDGAPSFERLVLGVTMDAEGRPEVVRADMADMVHLAVGGSSGWGKSVFLRALAYQLARSVDPVDLALIDLEGATLAPFSNCDRLLWPVADTETDAAAILGELAGELDRRKALFAVYPGVDSLRAYNARAPEPIAPIVAIIDEATALLENKAVETALRTLALRARKYGLWLVLAGQDWKASSLDTAIRNQLGARVQFKAMSASQSRVLLQRPGAEDLDTKGRALAWLPGRELLTIQAPFVGAEDLGAGLLGGGGPRAAIPSDTVVMETGSERTRRMRELSDQGMKPTPIARAVFGYVNSDVVCKVREAIAK